MEENIHLKNRLSQAVTTTAEKMSLEAMEKFHTRSIRQDDILSLLKHDIAEFDKLLLRVKPADKQLVQKVELALKKNRNNIKAFSKEFDELKTSFNSYLHESING